MRNDKHLAIKLRKKGLSYNKISKELSIPKSTMHYWFKDLRWSEKIKKKLNERNNRMARKRMKIISKVNSSKWEEWRESHRREARKEFNNLVKSPLFVGGLNMYWGEGDSKIENGMVRLANTDSRMIKLFVDFLEFITKIPIEKIKIYLVLYPDLSENKCINFWSQVTGISKLQFGKVQFIKGKHPTKRLEHGICTVHVNSRGLKEKIAVWIDLYYKKYKRI